MSKTKTICAFLLLALIAAPSARAAGFDLMKRLDKRLHESAERAKAADTPAEKRLILSKTFRKMTRTLDRVDGLPGFSDENRRALDDLRLDIQQKHDRLNGLNGFVPIPDAQLNDFADSVPQDLDLQNRSITISLVGALLIVIIIILIA